MQATLHAVGSDGGSLSRAKALRRFAPLLLGFILLLPIWIVKYPPLLDYPNHLASTFVLAHMGDPSFRFAESYKLHWGPYPYLTDILILGALDRIVPPLIAGKIFLSLCVLAFPLAARFFLRWANPGERAGTLWALLGGYNYFLLLGFLNFAMSLPVCLLALGLWLRFLEKPAGRRWLAAVVGMTALYFTHLIAFAFAALVMALYLFPYRKQWGQTIISALLCLPGVAIYLSFTRAIVGAPGYVDFAPFHDKLMNFSELAGGFSSQLGWFIIAGFVVCIVMCAVRNPEFGWNKRWAGVATALLAAYWAMPAAFGQGSFLDIRVLPLFFVVLLGIFRTGRRGGLIAVMAIIAFCMQISVVVRTFHAWQPELNSLSRSFNVIPRGARVLPMIETDAGPLERPFAHFWAYGMVERGWVAPYLLVMRDVTPFSLRSEVVAPDGFWDLEYDEEPDWDDIQDAYDYVWAFQVPKFRAPLANIGTLIYQNGALEIYRLRHEEKTSSKLRKQN